MALRNTNLTKIGNTTRDGVSTSGHTQMCLVQSATPLTDPGPRNLADPHGRRDTPPTCKACK